MDQIDYENKKVPLPTLSSFAYLSKRGPKPHCKVLLKWSADFAYAIGLIVSDGCLSSDGRHITFVSKDIDQIQAFCKALKINYLPKLYSASKGHTAFRVQIGDVTFYEFLVSIGLMPKKSLTIGPINVPSKFFSRYIRGYFDGDGYSSSYYDKRWKSSFMLAQLHLWSIFLPNDMQKRLRQKNDEAATGCWRPY